MRMVDEYHTKHGRRGVTGNSTPPSPDAASGGKKGKRGDWSSRPELSEGGSVSGGGGCSGTALPPIAPLSSSGPTTTDNQPTGRSADKRETRTAVELRAHMCLCCGAAGGKGHGRHCGHTFRRCGFCRAEEVRNVLFGAERGRGPVPNAGRRVDTPVRGGAARMMNRLCPPCYQRQRKQENHTSTTTLLWYPLSCISLAPSVSDLSIIYQVTWGPT